MEAKVSPETARLKAEFLAGGGVRLPDGLKLPFPSSRSTAGPGAGHASVLFAFGGTRAKKRVSRDKEDFDLVQVGGRFAIHRGGRPFISAVQLVPTLMHAPYQAFVNVDSSCIYGCLFCNSPRIPPHATKNLSDDRIIEMVMEASRREGFQSVALTSGVVGSPSESVERMAGLVKRVKAVLPDTPVGVEPYATRPDHVEALLEAGADEIKLNVQTYDQDIFEKVCPDLDFQHIMHAINHACEVFPRNRVCSNIIFGLGESDENVLEGAAVLANMGCVATLRALRRDEENIPHLEKALGPLPPVTADRMLRLATEEKNMLKKYGLTTLGFKTMCFSCLSCDIVPFWDV
jgi:biotin synthase-related radical SAM superfamily protein